MPPSSSTAEGWGLRPLGNHGGPGSWWDGERMPDEPMGGMTAENECPEVIMERWL